MRRSSVFRPVRSGPARRLKLMLQRSPRLVSALRAAGLFAGGFLTAGAPLLGRPLPLALALPAALPFGAGAVCSYLGLCLGYVVFWGTAAALEPAAAGVLLLAGTCMFRDLLEEDGRRFLPAAAAGSYALVASLALFKARFAPGEVVFFAARVLLLYLAARQLLAAFRARSRAGWAAGAVCLLAGAASVPLPGRIPLSAVLASGAVFLFLPGGGALIAAAVCGLTLDFTWAPAAPMTALFCLSALVCSGRRLRPALLRAAAFFLCCTAGILWSGGQNAAFPLAVLAGEALVLAIPERLRGRLTAPGGQAGRAEREQLGRAAALVGGIGRSLGRTRKKDAGPQSAAVFDRAAEQVCRSCGKWPLCWERCAADTYRELSGAAPRILARGEAREEDLPASFLSRCCHAAGFLTAVNEELDNQLARRQYQNRLSEARAVVAEQYGFLARLLQSLVQEEIAEPPARAVFQPDFGCRARGLRGSAISGDQGSCFAFGEWYYVLLCDGMGTGPDARSESAAAVELVTGLIRAGFDAQDALQMLNGLDILRDTGGFSTVDLAQVNLVTGEGYLHKWGAAPSYLKSARRVVKLGSAAPPAGLASWRRAECVRFSLAEGELLVLVSDGAAGAAAERFIREYSGLSPRELAAGVLGSAGAEAPDDRTAAALCLRPVPTGSAARARARTV